MKRTTNTHTSQCYHHACVLRISQDGDFPMASHAPLFLLKNPHFRGAFHLVKISGISGSAVNGTRFVGSSHWKIPRKSGKSKKVVPFSRLEFPNGMSCSIYVSRSLYQFQVHCRAPPRTGVYDQMEQLFTNRKFHFSYHRNFRVFFLNEKRPQFPSRSRWSKLIHHIYLIKPPNCL